MRKNLFLTTLLMLVATLGMAQKTTWPITLTTADGLPGEYVVQSYEYKSQVFNLEESVTKLRFTVVSTNTVDSLTEGSYDGYSAGWGPGFPFFAISELAIYNANGEKLNYTATCNAVAEGDGGGIAAINNGKVNDFLHTSYYRGDWPQAYHYIEVTLDEAVDAFSFQLHGRSNYQKNAITHLGVTPGTEYLPYPEQQFQLGEQVKTVEALAEEGALFVIQGNSADFNHVSGTAVNRWYKGATFYHSPYGSAETASAASLVYLTPDASVENGYKVTWLNDKRHIIAAERNNNGGITGQLWGTNNELHAGTVQFALATDSATMEGTFKLFMNDGQYAVSQNPRCRMELSKYNDTIPGNYYWTIYKASVSGAALAVELQATIDEAEKRIALYGGSIECDCGLHENYEKLLEAVAEAKTIVGNPEVTATEVIKSQNKLKSLLAAYTATSLWTYIDSIEFINDAVMDEKILIANDGEVILGAYTNAALQVMIQSSENAMKVIDSYKNLAEVDKALADIQEVIAAFWASKITEVQTLPIRVTEADGTPGEKLGYGGYLWESPVYSFSEKVDAIRLTFFKTNNMGVYSGTSYVFPTFAEIEIYDGGGNKVALTAESFSSNCIMTRPSNPSGDYQGYGALVDGSNDTHAHGTWSGTQVPSYAENPTYMYLDIAFPEPLNSFKYVQYGRKNAANTPTDFVIGKAGIDCTPESVPVKVDTLASLIKTAKAINVGIDPGAYSSASNEGQALIAAIVKAEAAADDAAKTAAYAELNAAVAAISSVATNPMEAGYYVIQAAYPLERVSKGELAISTYFNDFETGSPNCLSEYSLHWDYMPEDYCNAGDRFKFEFIPASESDKVKAWLEAGTISATDAANAYYIRSYMIDEYAGTSKDGARSQDIGFTDEAEEPYIVRPRDVAGLYDLWHPSHYNASMHIEGTSRDIVYWAGSATASQWKLRKIVYDMSVTATANGDATLSATTVNHGDSVVLSLAPKADYFIKSLKSNGKDVTAAIVNNEYVIGYATEDVNFEVEFDITMGDVNNDGAVSLSDLVAVINCIMDKEVPGINATAADVNGDGKIGVGDVVGIVNILLSSNVDNQAPNGKRAAMASSSESLDIASAENGAVAVELKNNVAYTAIQMDVELPEGASLVSATLGERAASHSVIWSKMNNGKVRVIAYSLSNVAIAGNSGELVTMNLQAEKAVTGVISVDNVRVVTADGIETAIGCCGSIVDINGTTSINSLDAADVKIYTAGEALVIESSNAFKASVYSLNGKLVEVLNVAAGKNIYTLPAGTYVVGGVKVIIK